MQVNSFVTKKGETKITIGKLNSRFFVKKKKRNKVIFKHNRLTLLTKISINEILVIGYRQIKLKITLLVSIMNEEAAKNIVIKLLKRAFPMASMMFFRIKKSNSTFDLTDEFGDVELSQKIYVYTYIYISPLFKDISILDIKREMVIENNSIIAIEPILSKSLYIKEYYNLLYYILPSNSKMKIITEIINYFIIYERKKCF